MQLLTLAAVTALTATVSAKVNISFKNNATCDYSQPKARIINRCPYDVYVWTVDSDNAYDCKFDEPVVLGTGESYAENFRPTSTGAVSLKVTKEEVCEHGKITQLEYNYKPEVNFLDISFVDCQSGECPGRQDGYYLQSGNENGQFPSAENNEHCPICVAHDQKSADECAYVLPDDRQTRSCDKKANLDFYICGSHEPGSEPVAPSKPKPSKAPVEEEPKPSTTSAPSYVADVAAAEITEAPQAPQDNIKTVYETVYAYTTVMPRKHRRHQQVHA
jgi:hypothetical protein